MVAPEPGKAKGGEASFSVAFFFGILDLVQHFFSIFQKDPWSGPSPLRISRMNLYKHHLFPLSHRAEGRQQGVHALYQVCVERGTEVDPGEVSAVILLGREDIGGEVVSVEKPPSMKSVQDVEHWWAILSFGAREGIATCDSGRRGLTCMFDSRGEGDVTWGHLRLKGWAVMWAKGFWWTEDMGMMVVRKQGAVWSMFWSNWITDSF
jgi:hypothetical protein